MKELKWNKFTRKTLPNCKLFWVSDFLSISLGRPDVLEIYTEEIKNECVWAEAEIEYPELPKKPDHSCTSKSWYTDIQAKCFLGANRRLFLIIFREDDSRVAHASDFSYVIEVKYCPLCGYKPEEK